MSDMRTCRFSTLECTHGLTMGPGRLNHYDDTVTRTRVVPTGQHRPIPISPPGRLHWQVKFLPFFGRNLRKGAARPLALGARLKWGLHLPFPAGAVRFPCDWRPVPVLQPVPS